jgi:hypothetical protein
VTAQILPISACESAFSRNAYGFEALIEGEWTDELANKMIAIEESVDKLAQAPQQERGGRVPLETDVTGFLNLIISIIPTDPIDLLALARPAWQKEVQTLKNIAAVDMSKLSDLVSKPGTPCGELVGKNVAQLVKESTDAYGHGRHNSFDDALAALDIRMLFGFLMFQNP